MRWRDVKKENLTNEAGANFRFGVCLKSCLHPYKAADQKRIWNSICPRFLPMRKIWAELGEKLGILMVSECADIFDQFMLARWICK